MQQRCTFPHSALGQITFMHEGLHELQFHSGDSRLLKTGDHGGGGQARKGTALRYGATDTPACGATAP
ncbi:MAG: hypothetical protein PVH54_05670 [Gammaproteobacteria bacterium]